MNRMAAAMGIMLGLLAGVTLATAGTETHFPFALYADF